MEAVAEGLWGMSNNFEKKGEVAKLIKCLEAICQSHVSFLPIVEVKTRIRIAAMLLHHTHNVNQAKYHLERAQLLGGFTVERSGRTTVVRRFLDQGGTTAVRRLWGKPRKHIYGKME